MKPNKKRKLLPVSPIEDFVGTGATIAQRTDKDGKGVRFIKVKIDGEWGVMRVPLTGAEGQSL